VQFVGHLFLEKDRAALACWRQLEFAEREAVLVQCSADRRAEHREPAPYRLATAAVQFLIDKIVPCMLVEFVARPFDEELGKRA